MALQQVIRKPQEDEESSNLPKTPPYVASNVDVKEYNTKTCEGKISLIEFELLDTLNYINLQIEDADLKSASVSTFSQAVIEGKKLLVEQKLAILKQLTALPETSLKLKRLLEGDEGKINDITSLFK